MFISPSLVLTSPAIVASPCLLMIVTVPLSVTTSPFSCKPLFSSPLVSKLEITICPTSPVILAFSAVVIPLCAVISIPFFSLEIVSLTETLPCVSIIISPLPESVVFLLFIGALRIISPAVLSVWLPMNIVPSVLWIFPLITADALFCNLILISPLFTIALSTSSKKFLYSSTINPPFLTRIFKLPLLLSGLDTSDNSSFG